MQSFGFGELRGKLTFREGLAEKYIALLNLQAVELILVAKGVFIEPDIIRHSL